MREQKWVGIVCEVSGDYFVAAVNIEAPVDSGNWQEPEALQALTSSALRVTLDESRPYVTGVSLIRR